ncbi:MAG: hypothetical protein V3T05_01045 [Myxococcota bacterium]
MRSGQARTIAKVIIGLGLGLTAIGCVHSRIDRTGRMRLGHGHEGKAPVLAALPDGYEEVAEVTVRADGIATAERLERHLLRRASLLGCDGVINMMVAAGSGAFAVCVRRHEPLQPEETKPIVVAMPSEDLMNRARDAGPEGRALLNVLAQAETRSREDRAWPLRWYLDTYPNSPFRGDVEALLVAPSVSRAVTSSASVRPAPTVE